MIDSELFLLCPYDILEFLVCVYTEFLLESDFELLQFFWNRLETLESPICLWLSFSCVSSKAKSLILKSTLELRICRHVGAVAAGNNLFLAFLAQFAADEFSNALSRSSHIFHNVFVDPC